MELIMTSQSFVVTGAASGIGAATMTLLRESGHHCISVDRVPPKSDARHLACDLADEAAIPSACAAIEGPLAGIAHVAGVPGTWPGPTVMRVNYLGGRRLIEGLMPKLADGASVVIVSSLAARHLGFEAPFVQKLLDLSQWQAVNDAVEADSIGGARAYEISKGLLSAWVPRATKSGAARGIRFNVISPGPVATPVLQDFRESMGHARVDAAEQLVGRLGRADEIAAVIAFLLGSAASWVNGTEIIVDGGLQALREVAAA
jgi:NAD(P)-dependent dehydrogenase (short-subunit alcohol dehydrogenase family)